MKELINRLKGINPILGAALITIAGVFLFASLFHTCREEKKLTGNNFTIVDTVVKTDVGECWVFYKKGLKEVKFGKTLEEVINNPRVEEVRLIQREGLGKDFFHVVWTKEGGFKRERI